MVLLDLICISFWVYVLHVCVCSSCKECFDLFGLLFFTYYVLRVTAKGEVDYGLVTEEITSG